MINKKIVIIGAGPTGLSLGYHLKQKDFNDFLILEKNPYPGGLSTSFKDKKGFVWDIGGHVIHDKNKEFVSFCKQVLKNNLIKQERKAFVYFLNKFIPYPFQNNLAFLPEKYKKECLQSLLSVAQLVPLLRENTQDERGNSNFQSWILSNFGQGIAKYFMIPQNQKTWQCPLDKLGVDWLETKVSLPPLEKIKKECQKKNPQILSWGSNASFYYPKKGGIGKLWQETANLIKSNLIYKTQIKKVDLLKRMILAKQGSSLMSYKFDKLISTIPINELIKISNADLKTKKLASQLKYTSGLVIGLGFNKKPVFNNWHWLYFPQKIYPFFRVCLQSNFSLSNVPDRKFSSFIIEIALRERREKQEKIINKTINQIGKIFFDDKNIKPISIFSLFVPYYYPIPTLNRNTILQKINKLLINNNILSLGRFGSWLYEKGNLDNCFEEGKILFCSEIPTYNKATKSKIKLLKTVKK